MTPIITTKVSNTDGIYFETQKAVIKSSDPKVEEFCNKNVKITGSMKLDQKWLEDKNYMAA